jgi:hypothetical protein
MANPLNTPYPIQPAKYFAHRSIIRAMHPKDPAARASASVLDTLHECIPKSAIPVPEFHVGGEAHSVANRQAQYHLRFRIKD